MKIYRYPQQKDWKELCIRPAIDHQMLDQQVTAILEEVRLNGDWALKEFAQRFDGILIDSLQVSEVEIQEAAKQVSAELRNAIDLARNNIERFHSGQIESPKIIDTMSGISCWRKSVAIDKVGLYIPGGTAPLFSTILMLGIPAMLAGCKEIILCSPPSGQGTIHPAILYTANLLGIKKIFKVGGAQAIGAMCYGTETIPSVYKIFGPGNQYVTAAKQIVQKSGTAIDMPAGPSEVAVFADETANVHFIAADLLSQAEHGKDSQVVFITTHESFISEVQEAIDYQLEMLSRTDIAKAALENSKIILVENETVAMDLLNEYAPEHLILATKNADHLADKVINAGSVFLGNYSPESVGDYASGTNHTLPTNGYAKAYSGVSVDSFVKKITFQKLDKTGLIAIGAAVEELAAAEGLDAHKNAVSIRLKDISINS